MPEYRPQAQRFPQDAPLPAEREARGVADGSEIPAIAAYPQTSIWQEDAARLRGDAIAGADNCALPGCFLSPPRLYDSSMPV